MTYTPDDMPKCYSHSYGGGASAGCSTASGWQWTYDPAGRLSGLLAARSYAGDNTPVSSLFSYDAAGNISAFNPDGRMDSSAIPPAQDLALSDEYVADDFGNIVEVKVPVPGSSTKSVFRYQYDAAGNLIFRQRPTQAPSELIAFSYDGLGRLLDVTDVAGGQTTTLFSFRYDEAGGTLDKSTCPELTFTTGRLRERSDPTGRVFYSYDELGRVTDEIRISPESNAKADDPAACGSLYQWNGLYTHYTYDLNDNLTSIRYPHGRTVTYRYGTGGLRNRVSSVAVSGLETDIITNAKWFPYGGLRAYEVNTPVTPGGVSSVEYLVGDVSSLPASKTTCDFARPSKGANWDESGRLRGIYISNQTLSVLEEGGPSNSGDVFKRIYQWKGDQVVEQDSCLLTTPLNASTTQARREQFEYDNVLQLRKASTPPGAGLAAVGGAYDLRTYGYDHRGNRTGLTEDGCSYSLTVGVTPESLAGMSSQCPWSALSYSYFYNADGDVRQKNWAIDSSGSAGWLLRPSFDTYSDVFKAIPAHNWVAGGGASGYYNYFYDAFRRRGIKEYPNLTRDVFSYDLGHQLLEDYFFDPAATTSAPIDEYIWLGGMPVAFMRAQTNGTAHDPDFTGTVTRRGESTNRGLYFIVNDHIGRPAVILDTYRRVANAHDYDPFGHQSRVSWHGDTAHPYGTGAFSQRIAWLRQPPGDGATVRARVRYHMVDTEPGCLRAPCDFARVRTTAGYSRAIDGGYHKGPVVGGWDEIPDGILDVYFSAAADNCAPSGNLRNCTASTTFPYQGVSTEGFDYIRYQIGATPVTIPLRGPGMYYDAETDLFENWHRYYDPSIGRYLQPEPLLQRADVPLTYAALGKQLNPYSYAGSNPIGNADWSGLDYLAYNGLSLSYVYESSGIVTGSVSWLALSGSTFAPDGYAYSASAIPDGTYNIDLINGRETTRANGTRWPEGYGWRLKAALGTYAMTALRNAFTPRSSFFIHSGSATAGCLLLPTRKDGSSDLAAVNWHLQSARDRGLTSLEVRVDKTHGFPWSGEALNEFFP